MRGLDKNSAAFVSFLLQFTVKASQLCIERVCSGSGCDAAGLMCFCSKQRIREDAAVSSLLKIRQRSLCEKFSPLPSCSSSTPLSAGSSTLCLNVVSSHLLYLHVAPFLHGLLWHSFTSVSQCRPSKPRRQMHLKIWTD